MSTLQEALTSIKGNSETKIKEVFQVMNDLPDHDLVALVKEKMSSRTRKTIRGICSYYDQYNKLSVAQRWTLVEWCTDKLMKEGGEES